MHYTENAYAWIATLEGWERKYILDFMANERFAESFWHVDSDRRTELVDTLFRNNCVTSSEEYQQDMAAERAYDKRRVEIKARIAHLSPEAQRSVLSRVK